MNKYLKQMNVIRVIIITIIITLTKLSPVLAGGGAIVDTGGGYGEMQAQYAAEILPEVLQLCLQSPKDCELIGLNTKQLNLFITKVKSANGIITVKDCDKSGAVENNYVAISSCDLYLKNNQNEVIPKSLNEILVVVINAYAKAFGFGAIELHSVLHFDQQDLLLTDIDSAIVIHQIKFSMNGAFKTIINVEFKDQNLDLTKAFQNKLNCTDFKLTDLRFQNLNVMFITGKVESSNCFFPAKDFILQIDAIRKSIDLQLFR